MGIIALISLTSCSQDEQADDILGNQQQADVPGVKVENGYLSFTDDNTFKTFINSLSENRTVTTRSTSAAIKGFNSIASIKEHCISTRSSNDDEEMSQDEFNVMKAEDLLLDPVLTEVMDTTLRIKIEDRIYRITKYGTFSSNSDNLGNINEAIEHFDSTLVDAYDKGEYINLGNGVTFTNSFGKNSSKDEEMELVDEIATRSVDLNLHNGYNVNTYQWKNNSLWQNFWDKLRGKDVSKENNFDSKKRVQVNIFDINYGFYASAGIKVKMQRRKKFLFIKYWVSEDADKLAIGFNKVYGVLKLENPRSFSAIAPTNSTKWSTFTGTINNISSKFMYGQYHKLSIVRDWVDDIYMFLPEITLLGNTYPNKDIMNKLYDAPADYMCSFLKSQAGKYVYSPIKKQIQPKIQEYPIWFGVILHIRSTKRNHI